MAEIFEPTPEPDKSKQSKFCLLRQKFANDLSPSDDYMFLVVVE